MTDLPSHVDIHEEGPREGFQIEPGPIGTADKIRLIEALAETGLKHIQVCSFVNPAPGAGLGRRRGRGRGLQGEAGARLHGPVVQRQRTGAGAQIPRQAHHHRRDCADCLRRLYAQEPQPQPCRERGGDAQADRPAPLARRARQPHRRDGRVRLQLPRRHRARAGRAHARGWACHRRRSGHRNQVVLAGRHDGLGDARAHRARARRGARALAATSSWRCTCTTPAASR